MQSREFVFLMALMTSFIALSIDAMLPALGQISQDLEIHHKNDRQLIISVLFLGLAMGMLIYGPISDSTGRKPPVYAGLMIFLIGTLFCIYASDFKALLLGRFLQGVGAAGPRIVAMAIIRDQFTGSAMARIMSLILSVFIIVPVIAPMLGQIILSMSGWREIFFLLFVLAVVGFLWFAMRQSESLLPIDRVPLSLGNIFLAVKETVQHRTVLAYSVASGFIFAAFLGYLNSSQQILQELYQLGSQFPYYFGLLAISLGLATYINSRLVMRYGMHRLSRLALLWLSVTSIIFAGFSWYITGRPDFWILMVYLLVVFFCIGILFGNLNSLAMEPVGHIAGTASAVISFYSTLSGLLIGGLIGRLYNETVLPLVAGFAILGLLALLMMYWAETE